MKPIRYSKSPRNVVQTESLTSESGRGMWRFLLRASRACIVLFVLSACMALAQTSLNSSVEPIYRNHVHGYAVELPRNLIYTRTVPPNPDHGFGVLLDGDTKLWVDASYTESSSTKEEANTQSSGCRIKDRRPSKLGSRAALSLRFSCPANAYGAAYEEILVLTVFREVDRSPVSYQVGMRASTPAVLSKNMALFHDIVAGFQFEK